MIRLAVTALLILVGARSIAQHNMRPVEGLLTGKDNSWPLVQDWIKNASNKIEVLPCDRVRGKDELFKAQVTDKSPMGAIVHFTGGILVDGGWIRILGAGHPRLNRSLPDWNKGKAYEKYGQLPHFLLIADDAAGGFYAINGGLFGKDAGKVYYLAPDNPEWEGLGLTYTEFLNFCFNGDLDGFYKDMRWNGWREDVGKLEGDKVYSFFPYLFSKEGADVNIVARNVVPVEEQYRFAVNMVKQVGMRKKGF